MRELRGKYDIILKFIARNPGRPHQEIIQALREGGGGVDTQLGGYLKVLMERFNLVERKLPVFAKPEVKRGRYYLSDNFLRAWLAALANPVAAIAFRPIDQLIEEADRRLAETEGGALEKLVGQLYEERSRKMIGNFPLTERVQGYWDKSGTEIDLVVVNTENETIRFGSCRRSSTKLLADVLNFKQHVERFLELMPKYRKWRRELVGIAPDLNDSERTILQKHEVIPEDLNDLIKSA